jgi:glycosyltransferase involved in cell wall biosynthesis
LSVRVLLLHNFYDSRKPSGENQVFGLERDLLIKHGHEVRSYVRHSDELIERGRIGTILGAAATPWNPRAARAVRRAVQAFHPDVVHAHNTFPLLSPSIFPAVGTRAARVLTLHNYRLFCPAAIPLRDGKTCTECLDRRSVVPAVRYGCYRGSRLATLPLALSVAIARATLLWQRHVDAFIALTEFQRDLMTDAGLPAERVFVKPNFYPGRPVVRAWAERRRSVVFVGRLSEEKGVAHLLEAWAAWGADAPELRIVGDGPLRSTLETQASRTSLRVRFLGQLSGGDAESEIAGARLLVLPSIWFEGFPLVIREALAFGTPAAVSNIGPLPALVDHGRAGLVFRPGEPASLLATVRRGWETPGELERLGAAARRCFEDRYGEDANHALLMHIYERAVESCRERRAGARRAPETP